MCSGLGGAVDSAKLWKGVLKRTNKPGNIYGMRLHLVSTYLTVYIKSSIFDKTMEKAMTRLMCEGCQVKSTLVISKSKGPSEILRDILTSTYQMCRTEENTNRTTKFHK